ncbi:MAG: hypothetical protein D6701_13440, partial [Gemmatimonadetes bacterium]
MVGASAARELWPEGGAVGGRLRFSENEPWGEVVGVVGDVLQQGLDDDPTRLQFYVPFDGLARRANVVVRSSAPPPAALTALRTALRSAEPDMVLSLSTMRERLRDSIATRRFTMALVVALGALAAFLASLG